MTKHRPSHERIDEILEAAADEIYANGYHNLTMDAIAARTSLSKGGVYRFYANKRDVALALVEKLLSTNKAISFDIEEALAWGLGIEDTLLKLLLPHVPLSESEKRRWLIWIQLLPTMITDPDFVAVRIRVRQQGVEHYRRLLEGLFERDNITVEKQEGLLEQYAVVGTAFLEGLTIFVLAGEPIEDLRAQIADYAYEFIRIQLEKVSHAIHQP